jgi:chorismate synthase
MGSSFGRNITITVFGQSHSKAIGVAIEGLPAGFRLDLDDLNRFLQRRAPGKSDLATKRLETDAFEILSGTKDDVLCGAPFCAIIPNKDARPGDYTALRDTPRPGHSDYTAEIKYNGAQDVSGGGHFSGRLTAPLCLAGGICLQILKNKGIEIGAHIERVGVVQDKRFDPVHVSASDFMALRQMHFPALDRGAAEAMISAIEAVGADGDSLGGVIECAAIGLPAGLGDPIFEGMENRIAAIIFGIPAIKAIEFGNGFTCAMLHGSENNDGFHMVGGHVRTMTNNHGGILGGITSGMPVIFRVAIKPTPSIFKEQESVSLSKKENTTFQIQGRHDPCIVPRAVPCVEAATAIAVYDAWLDDKKYR